MDARLEEVFLDPNNPRFFIEPQNIVPDNKITEKAVQEKCLVKMKSYGIDDLKESIRKVGFLQIDKVVVRLLDTNKYVTVEGNRRIAALQILKNEVDIGEVQLPKEIENSIRKLKVVLYKGKEKDIAWVVQAIRHISGIRSWPSYQQAEILNKIMGEKKINLRDAANSVGIGPKVAARLIRAYQAYQQAKKDDEHGQYIVPSHFSYFEEAIFVKPAIQTWLSWNETSKKFENIANLKKLLCWITTQDEGEPRINRAIDLRDVLSEVINQHPDLMKRFENDETITIEKLNFELGKRTPVEVEDWLFAVKDCTRDLMELPSVKIVDRKEEFTKALEELSEIIKKHLEILKKLTK